MTSSAPQESPDITAGKRHRYPVYLGVRLCMPRVCTRVEDMEACDCNWVERTQMCAASSVLRALEPRFRDPAAFARKNDFILRFFHWRQMRTPLGVTFGSEMPAMPRPAVRVRSERQAHGRAQGPIHGQRCPVPANVVPTHVHGERHARSMLSGSVGRHAVVRITGG